MKLNFCKKAKAFLIASLLFSVLLKAQNQDLTQRVGDDICDCFNTKYILSQKQDLELLNECYLSISDALKEEFTEEGLKVIDSTKNLNYFKSVVTVEELGSTLFDSTQPYLIDNCDSYYSYVDRIYEDIFESLVRKSSPHQIDSLSQLVKKDKKNTDYIWKGWKGKKRF